MHSFCWFVFPSQACEELQKQLHSRLLGTEIGGACDLEYQTLDDLERKERDYSDHILDNVCAFPLVTFLHQSCSPLFIRLQRVLVAVILIRHLSSSL